MNVIDKELLIDLQIYDKVLQNIDNTETIYGKTKLSELLSNLIYDINLLNRRQEIIKTIFADTISNRKNIINLNKKLKEIHTYENLITEWFSDKFTKKLYYTYDIFNKKIILNYGNKIKYCSFVLYFIVFLFIYIIFRRNGLKYNFNDYIKQLYNSYLLSCNLSLSLYCKNNTAKTYISHVTVSIYMLFLLYKNIDYINECLTHYDICKLFTKKFNNMINIINNIEYIWNNDKYFINEKQYVSVHILELKKIFKKNTSLGYKLDIWKNRKKYENHFKQILQYIGLIDAFMSISLLLHDNYTLPYFIHNSHPITDVVNMYNPILGYSSVKNNVELTKNNFMIITGPNKAGKSTYMKSILINLLFAQTIGVVAAESFITTPYNYLYSYLNIADSIGNESLFEAELNRCHKYIKIVENLKDSEFTFATIDELFTGTNYTEGIASSYSVCKYLKNFKKSVVIVSTHFTELCKINTVLLKYFKTQKINDTYIYDYKILDGISNQNIAIDLLKEKGYNDQIINVANNYKTDR
jgi:DNA mismatch repair ATPase MutS